MKSHIRPAVKATMVFLLTLWLGGCAAKSARTRHLPPPNAIGAGGIGNPAITEIGGVVSNGVLTLKARFAPATFDARTTRVAWILDTDSDLATGSPGLFGAPGVSTDRPDRASDTEIVGADAVALVTGTCDVGTLLRFDRPTGKWLLADGLPAVASSTGFDSYVAVDSLAANPGQISFKAIWYTYSGDCPPNSINSAVKDVSPSYGAPAARVIQTTIQLAPPKPIAPADKSRFENYPRMVALEWSAVPDATAYLIQAQYADPTATGGWQPLIFRRTSDSRTGFEFVGAQAGRWRVWALNPDGLAGTPTHWLTFQYLR